MKKSIIIFSILSAIIFMSCNSNNTKDMQKNKAKTADTVIVKKNSKFGIKTDNYKLEEKIVKRNQNISDLLLPYGISQNDIFTIALADSVFNTRKIRTGNKYFTFLKKDSTQHLDYMVYAIDKIRYVVFDFTDSTNLYLGENEVIKNRRKVSGEITSSLWNAFVDKDEDPMLANELSEIYAWSIDFFGIQKGDKFTIVYDELMVDTERVGIGTIYTAKFTNSGKDFYAFRFLQDSVYTYFDENGNSLRKTFLKAPLKYSRISSHFSNRRFHPVLKIYRAHHGVDYAAPTGTPVHSIGDGKVIKKGWDNGGGNFIKIKHNSVYTTTYMHLSKFASGIKIGDFVTQGQVVGYVGSTGLATGPHLDFRVYKNGHAINPLKLEAPPAEPVKKENIEAFNKVKDELMKEL
jgi:murein DD-endopeptidase MepM/ murein hydrolase activator NlpD